MGINPRRTTAGERQRLTTSRHQVHWEFSRDVLPAQVFSNNPLDFYAALLGRRYGRDLADLWNRSRSMRLGGDTRSFQTRPRDFTRHVLDMTERWRAIVITLPPALEPDEAHFVGFLFDNQVLTMWADQGQSPRGHDGAVRYLCLERGKEPGTTQWSNGGPGPAPSVDAMSQALADMVGIKLNFGHKPESGQVAAETQSEEIGPKANLEGKDLQGTNLEGKDLEGANLQGANLKGANLKGANLKGANLQGANLKGATLETALLRGVKLSGANLEGTSLFGTKLEGVKLEGVIADDHTVWPEYGLDVPTNEKEKQLTSIEAAKRVSYLGQLGASSNARKAMESLSGSIEACQRCNGYYFTVWRRSSEHGRGLPNPAPARRDDISVGVVVEKTNDKPCTCGRDYWGELPSEESSGLQEASGRTSERTRSTGVTGAGNLGGKPGPEPQHDPPEESSGLLSTEKMEEAFRFIDKAVERDARTMAEGMGLDPDGVVALGREINEDRRYLEATKAPSEQEVAEDPNLSEDRLTESSPTRAGKRSKTSQSQQPKPAPTENPDLPEDLEKLSQLFERGLLTEDEFTAAKQRLLGS